MEHHYDGSYTTSKGTWLAERMRKNLNAPSSVG
jgi:hypothetical protein